MFVTREISSLLLGIKFFNKGDTLAFSGFCFLHENLRI